MSEWFGSDPKRLLDRDLLCAAIGHFLGAVVGPTRADGTHASTGPGDLGPDDLTVLALLIVGRKIEAIRLRRHQTGEGLKEAKDYVDTLEHILLS